MFLSFPATETAQQLKKTAGVPFHAKGRGLVKKLDTTSKLQRLICSLTIKTDHLNMLLL